MQVDTPGEARMSQHRLVCADMQISNTKEKKQKLMKKIKVWKLKDSEKRRENCLKKNSRKKLLVLVMESG